MFRHWFDRKFGRILKGEQLVAAGNTHPQNLEPIEPLLSTDRRSFVKFLAAFTVAVRVGPELAGLGDQIVEAAPNVGVPDAVDSDRFGLWFEFDSGHPLCLGQVLHTAMHIPPPSTGVSNVPIGFRGRVAFPREIKLTLAITGPSVISRLHQYFDYFNGDSMDFLARDYKREAHFRFGVHQIVMPQCTISEISDIEFDPAKGTTVEISLMPDHWITTLTNDPTIPDYEQPAC